MERHLLDLLARDGSWVLFVAQTLGIFGLPIPDELLLIVAGGMVRRGELPGPATLVAAVAGSATGLTLSYALGRLGTRLLHRLPSFDGRTLDRAQAWFKRFGQWLLVFSCFVPGIRHVAAVAAGAGPLAFRTFCVYGYLGAAVWSTAFLAIGYYAAAGQRWQHAALVLRAHLVLVAALVGALGVAYAFASRTRSKRQSE